MFQGTLPYKDITLTVIGENADPYKLITLHKRYPSMVENLA